MTYYYDGYSGGTYTVGRLAAAVYGSTDPACGGPGVQFEEMFSYTQGGQVSGKTLRANLMVFGYGLRSASLSSAYTYNAEGQILTEGYPGYYADNGQGGTPYVAGASHTYEYNALGQLTGIKETSPNANLYHVGNMQYGAAGQLTSLSYAGGSTQAHVYNERLQMTKQTFSTGLEFQYIYPATGNNGQIQDFTIKSGSTTVQTARYNYDSLARLSSASTIAGTISWSQAYNYDGFGNLNSAQQAFGMALHETLHFLGVTDNDIGRRLGLDTRNTAGYSSALAAHCKRP